LKGTDPKGTAPEMKVGEGSYGQPITQKGVWGEKPFAGGGAAQDGTSRRLVFGGSDGIEKSTRSIGGH